MTLLGSHISIAGGYHRAVEKGAALHLSAIQIFPKNQLQWASKQLSDGEIESYRESRSKHPEIAIVFAHGSYLYNFASPEDALVEKSKACLTNELVLCDVLSLPYLVIHPGSHMGTGEQRGLDRVVENLGAVLEKGQGSTTVCIETTSGQGYSLGSRFEHLRDIIQGVGKRIGACIDSCHIFAAGYDIRTRRGYQKVMDEFNRVVGFSFLKVIHLNDSKGELGSQSDRHAHIGHGKIGRKSFRFFMQDPQFFALPKVIETPKKLGGREMDSVNIQILRGFVK